MAFIETADTVVGVQVQQIYGDILLPASQPAELTFKFLPGSPYTERVVALLPAAALGQQQASGTAARPVNIQPAPFAVRVKLDDPTIAAGLPAGTTGEAAIYTDSAMPTHLIRQVMIRMSAYLDCVIPF